MTSEKSIALTRWTFVGKVMSLLLNMLSRLVINFLPRSKRLLISWLSNVGSDLVRSGVGPESLPFYKVQGDSDPQSTLLSL